MIHIYIYAANRLWDTERTPLGYDVCLEAACHNAFREKHVRDRLGSGWVVGNSEVIQTGGGRSVPISPLVGSDLHAWHRSWRDDGLPGNNPAAAALLSQTDQHQPL